MSRKGITRLSAFKSQTIGTLLADRLKREKMNQNQLSKRAGVSRARISDYIKNGATPTTIHLTKILNAFRDMNPEEKVHWHEIRERQQSIINEKRKIFGKELKRNAIRKRLEQELDFNIFLHSDVEILGEYEAFPSELLEYAWNKAKEEVQKEREDRDDGQIDTYVLLRKGNEIVDLHKMLIKNLNLSRGDIVGKYKCYVVVFRKDAPVDDRILFSWNFETGFNSVEKMIDPKRCRLLKLWQVDKTDLNGTPVIAVDTLPGIFECIEQIEDAAKRHEIESWEIFSVLAEVVREKCQAIQRAGRKKEIVIKRDDAFDLIAEIKKIKDSVFGKKEESRDLLRMFMVNLEEPLQKIRSELFSRTEQQVALLKVAENFFRTQMNKLRSK